MQDIMRAITAAIDELSSDRAKLDEQIETLKQALESVEGKPRATARSAKPTTKAARKKRNWSPAAKKAAADRMRKYWADRKKAEAKAARAPKAAPAKTRATSANSPTKKKTATKRRRTRSQLEAKKGGN